ncbi:putative protein phosphatase 2C 46 [Camellia lanceoleosa]|uniref:Uncharacterized protein n=1 Tax=Camellia lanceoleosa TaxID=1840588 RepID=A0ACC0IBZ7_9ERIC|nr:putative protein phosphatase 2C 46 [Camellia lanceoleosa]
MFVHKGSIKEGSIEVGEEVEAAVDAKLRQRAKVHHTATHLLQAALKIKSTHERATGEVLAIQLSTEHNASIESVRQELHSLHPDDPHIVVLKHNVWRVKGLIQAVNLVIIIGLIKSVTHYFLDSERVYPSLRVAYIDEVEEPSKDASKKINQKVYYSEQVKAALPKFVNSSEAVQNLDQAKNYDSPWLQLPVAKFVNVEDVGRAEFSDKNLKVPGPNNSSEEFSSGTRNSDLAKVGTQFADRGSKFEEGDDHATMEAHDSSNIMAEDDHLRDASMVAKSDLQEGMSEANGYVCQESSARLLMSPKMRAVDEGGRTEIEIQNSGSIKTLCGPDNMGQGINLIVDLNSGHECNGPDAAPILDNLVVGPSRIAPLTAGLRCFRDVVLMKLHWVIQSCSRNVYYRGAWLRVAVVHYIMELEVFAE